MWRSSHHGRSRNSLNGPLPVIRTARNVTLGITGHKVEQTSLGVAHAVPKSPKPTFKETAAPATTESWSSDRC
jgi:hypothetical protein